MPQLRFEGRLESDKEAHFIRVPAAVVTALGQGKRVPVNVTLNGYTYRSRIAVNAGQYYLGVGREGREAAGAAVGDQLMGDRGEAGGDTAAADGPGDGDAGGPAGRTLTGQAALRCRSS
jgi:hypothetical protein